MAVTLFYVALAMPACAMYRVCCEAIMRASRHSYQAVYGPSYQRFEVGPAIGLGFKRSVAWSGAYALTSLVMLSLRWKICNIMAGPYRPYI